MRAEGRRTAGAEVFAFGNCGGVLPGRGELDLAVVFDPFPAEDGQLDQVDARCGGEQEGVLQSEAVGGVAPVVVIGRGGFESGIIPVFTFRISRFVVCGRPGYPGT